VNDGCPSTDTLLEVLGDGVDSEIEAEIEAHIGECARCRQRLDVLTNCPTLAGAAANGDSAWALSHSRAVINNVAAALAEESGRSHLLSGMGPGDFEHEEPTTPNIPGYEIYDRLGTGGSADVYRAFHHQLRRVVALKVGRERASPEQRDRFRREAEALAKLRHPGVVQIYETGQVDGSLFMAIEYESGGSLAQFLQGTPQPPIDAARFLASAAAAIHAAHKEGLVHRDIKPANILLAGVESAATGPVDQSEANGEQATKPMAAIANSYPIPKLTDFGLVKQVAEESGLTESRDVLGTPSYMAPEQVSGSKAPIGPATDVYALGAVLYEMLTGRPPFRAATAIDTVVQVRFDEPVPPSRLTPSVPRDLETVCLKCLEKEPSRRYATAAELAEDLTRFAEGRPVKARPIRWPIRIWRWTRRNPRVAALSTAVFSLLAILAVVGPIVAYRQANLRRNAQESEAKAIAQWDRADRNLLAANDAVWQSLRMKLAELDRSADPADIEMQLQIIERAKPFLEQARAHDPDLPFMRQRWGMVFYFHGRAALRSRDWRRAAEDLESAAVTLEKLAEDRPDQHEAALFAARSRFEQARLAMLNSPNEAEKKIREAIGRFENLSKISSIKAEACFGLAEACRLLADFLETQPQRHAELADALQRSVNALEQAGSGPTNQGIESILILRMRSAKHHMRQGQIVDAEDELRRIMAASNKAQDTNAPTPMVMLLRCQTAELLAENLLQQKRWNDADRESEVAVRMADGLNELLPETPDFKLQLIRSYHIRGRALLGLGNPETALKNIDRALLLARSMTVPGSILSNIEKSRAEALKATSETRAP
jgi:serine/threonine protein kinase